MLIQFHSLKSSILATFVGVTTRTKENHLYFSVYWLCALYSIVLSLVRLFVRSATITFYVLMIRLEDRIVHGRPLNVKMNETNWNVIVLCREASQYWLRLKMKMLEIQLWLLLFDSSSCFLPQWNWMKWLRKMILWNMKRG